jgi:hypothetical protein
VNGLILFVVTFLVDWRQFQGVGRDDFDVRAAFLALDDIALFDLIDIDIQWMIALRANDWHNPLLTLSFRSGGGLQLPRRRTLVRWMQATPE